MTAGLPPSGHQVELTSGSARAVVVSVGGGVRSLTLAGREVLDAYGVGERIVGFRGHHLIPWPNRVGDGTWAWLGEALQLPLTEPANRTALHGLTCWSEWMVDERAEAAVLLSTEVPPQPGWPGRLTASCQWVLDPHGLTAQLRIRNDAAIPLPFGYGTHPYLRARSGLVDGETLHLPAQTRLLTDERQLPLGKEPVAGTRYDFTESRPVGDLRLDDCFGDLARETDGKVVARFGDVEIWGDKSFRWFQVYSGETLPPGQRRRSLAIEPMTCPPDALRSGQDLIQLEPGEQWSGSWGIRLTA